MDILRYSLILTVLFLGLSFFSTEVNAQIRFDQNGRWETTFDCPEWNHPDRGWYDPCPNESGLQSRGGTVDGKRTKITSDANYPQGGGGRGARFWTGSGDANRQSAHMRVTFDTRQPELWVSYYFRYEQGFQWVYGAGAGTKEIYWDVNMSGGGADAYTGIMDTTVRTVNQGGARIDGRLVYPSSGGSLGWDHIYSGGVSDGSWHSMEVYMLIESGDGRFDGAGRIWVNGELVAEQTNMNWGGNSGASGHGWTHFEFLSNQKDPGLSRAYYADVDDMVIYNRTPPNTDAHGNPFIGAVGGGGGGTPSPAPPSSVTIRPPTGIAVY